MDARVRQLISRSRWNNNSEALPVEIVQTAYSGSGLEAISFVAGERFIRVPAFHVLILRLFLLWGLIALHVIGGAVLFRRLLPRESPWFGFFAPSLGLVIVLNFVEHISGLEALRLALPVTFLGSIWLLTRPDVNWRLLGLPTATFLVSFAFTLAIRGLKPDIEAVRDGQLDVHLVADYLMGGALPPVSTWLPPFRQCSYYSFEHYGASVLIRLFGFHLGTGFNVASALLAAFIFQIIAAIAWRLGGHKVWIVILCVVLTASAMTGSTAYLWLLTPDKEPDDTTDLLNRADPGSTGNYLFHDFLRPTGIYDSHELLPPGYWGWIGSFHSTVAGQFLTLLTVYCAVEMARRRRSNLPWIGCGTCCVLLLLCSTWGLPFAAALAAIARVWSLGAKTGPRDWRIVIRSSGVIGICLTPLCLYYLQTQAPAPAPIAPQEKTQLFEFIVQWWPIYLPLAALLFSWRSLHPVTGIVVVLVAASLVLMEHWTIADRLDMTGKVWGFLYGAAWAVLIPNLARNPSWATRGTLALLIGMAAVSICFWIDYTDRTISDDRWHLDGVGDYRTDPVKGRILDSLAGLDHQVIITGKCEWAYNEAPLLVAFSRNYDYVADDFDCDNHFNPGNFGEGKRRADEVNAFYEGKDTNPLGFVLDRRIAAVVIWPEDAIPDAVLAQLRTDLKSQYYYRDCRDQPTDQPNGGVFFTASGSDCGDGEGERAVMPPNGIRPFGLFCSKGCLSKLGYDEFSVPVLVAHDSHSPRRLLAPARS